MEGESSTFAYDELESILNGSSGPCSLPVEYLRRITNNFSDERLLGEGGFGKVYKGVLQNGKMVAIKRLNNQLLKPGVQGRQFENEVQQLMRLKHPNIVRFLCYCYEIQNQLVEHNGKYIFAEAMQQKLICLEYLPNGSLDRHLSDESSRHDWHTYYKIIKGICCGLLYLHEECQSQFGASIVHLDLKPGNILLDEHMGPKISDFGLSRLFEDNKTQTCATSVLGSLGYMAPEYLIQRIVTVKADIYNLGVIITEIITGTKVDIFSFSSPTSCQKFVDDVINNWRNRLGGALSETDCKQIKCCLEIGLGCIKFDRKERPTSREIIQRLDRWETTNCNVNNEKRPPVDQISTHMEEKQPSVSTTGYETITGMRNTEAEDNNSKISTHMEEKQPSVSTTGYETITGVRSTEAKDNSSKISTHMEEKHPSNSTTGYETITGVRSMDAEDNNSNTNTKADPKPYRSLNRSRARDLFHRHLSRVMKFLSCSCVCIILERRLERRSMSRIRRACHDSDIVINGSYNRDSHPLPVRDPTTEFTFAQMEAVTKGFSLESKIGEGSFGTVYRGYLPDGREVAIKRDHGFQESELLSCLRHEHLVEIVGYCTENKERLLICEYMKNGSLYDHLHPKAAPSESSPSMVMSSWKLRIRILLEASRGIEYLHSYTVRPIIHGGVKSSNILLDASWRARISEDFGLSLMEGVMATGMVGYTDPEYYSLHHLTVKSDMYSFGVVILEVLTGKRAILEEAEGASPLSVVDYAVPSIVSGELGKVLDPRVPEPATHEAEALGLVAYTALHCVQLKGKDRPGMEGVAANLQIAFDLCEGSFDGDLVKSPSSDSLPTITPIDQD